MDIEPLRTAYNTTHVLQHPQEAGRGRIPETNQSGAGVYEVVEEEVKVVEEVEEKVEEEEEEMKDQV
ncbi:hypothetical protein NHX12_032869 [Muraenolepis orangiensis]|uniref:Uncharacterized protein n=1 Tax=Muraenolepis orangiensis TaxID=630683 RepID=A0A9Q0E420_9TELE|nr:hypothetical protein NHX12_032869 [Muraenolepis orangiensis]